MNGAIDPALAVAIVVNVLKPLLERRGLVVQKP